MKGNVSDMDSISDSAAADAPSSNDGEGSHAVGIAADGSGVFKRQATERFETTLHEDKSWFGTLVDKVRKR